MSRPTTAASNTHRRKTASRPPQRTADHGRLLCIVSTSKFELFQCAAKVPGEQPDGRGREVGRGARLVNLTRWIERVSIIFEVAVRDDRPAGKGWTVGRYFSPTNPAEQRVIAKELTRPFVTVAHQVHRIP